MAGESLNAQEDSNGIDIINAEMQERIVQLLYAERLRDMARQRCHEGDIYISKILREDLERRRCGAFWGMECSEEETDSDDSAWDPEAAISWMYDQSEEPPWGIGLNIKNANDYAPRIRAYAEKHGDELFEGIGDKVFVYYSLLRVYEHKKEAVCDAVGFNSMLLQPLSNKVFYKTLNSAEKIVPDPHIWSVNKGCFYTPKGISRKFGISMEELNIGVRERARMHYQASRENKKERDERIGELMASIKSTYKIAKQLKQEGYDKVSEPTVRRICERLRQEI